MQSEAAKKLIRDTLEQPFSKDQFTKFAMNLLNTMEDAPFTYRGNYIFADFQDYVEMLERVGKYEDPDGKLIDVLIVHLKKTTSLERARASQRKYVAKYLKGSRGNELKDAALVAFVSPNEADWRFSFVKMEYKFDEKGKIKEEFTPARRYSFLVGENENSHTAQSQLLPILANTDKNPAIAQLEEAFRIEKVTKEFFEQYRELYHEVKESLDELVSKDKEIRTDFESKGIETVDFAKKLLGQIVFLYFLQKKGWFGVKRKAVWGTGSKAFLRELFLGNHGKYDNFFNDILEPLFYNTLAVERSENYADRFDCKIPFLNGGLFDPLNNYDWINTEILLSNELFSNRKKTKNGDVGTGILDVFDRYNFTVKEDEPLEKEVAVDPEMLGKVFEHLLEVKDRKSKGTYYTPREIVHYMCQESLINYLATECEVTVPREDVETLVKHGETAQENDTLVQERGEERGRYKYKLPESVRGNAEAIDQKLVDIKVCDPAVGSGAFLVGMMSEIVRTRMVLTQFLGNSDRTSYDLKRHAIQNSLYGVDIDLGAVEIAKLRLWLSLIVDEEDYKQIKPLPNLDYKIMQGNSLLEEYEGINLIDKRFFDKQEDKEIVRRRLEQDQSKLQREYIHLNEEGNLTKTKKAELEKRLKEKDKALKELDKPRSNGQDELGLYGQSEVRSKADKLLDLHEQFFSTYNKGQKDRLKKQIETFTWDLIEATLKQQGRIDKLDRVRRFQQTNTRPFFLWRLHFADVFRIDGGFNVIVANPPYKQLSKDKSVSASYKQALKEKHGTSAGRLNTFVFFLHEAVARLNSHGQLAYIVPNTILTQDYYSYSRKTLLSQMKLLTIVTYDDMQFDSAVVENVTLLMQKRTETESGSIRVMRQDRDEVELLREKCESEFLVPPNYVWSIEEQSLADQIMRQEHVPLSQICNVNQAIALKGDKQKSLSRSNPDGKFYKLLDGRNIQKYVVKWDGVYLNYNVKRIHSCKRKDIFLTDEKIFFRRVATDLICAYDDKQYFALNTLVVITKKAECELDLKCVLALMNSRLLNFIYKAKFKSTKRVFSEIQARSVGRLPIPHLSPKMESQLVAKVKAILRITSSKTDDKNPSDVHEVASLQADIDRLVYEAYHLTQNDISIVERS